MFVLLLTHGSLHITQIMSNSEQNHLTQQRKEQLQKALDAVREINGSPDIIAALLSALEEYDEK